MGVEVGLKAWLSGGSFKVNKKTWFSHWFRGGIGFPYHLSENSVEKARQYSRDLWLNNKWDKQTRDFNWLLDKFNPPGWKKERQIPLSLDKKEYYKYTAQVDGFPKWFGVDIVKYPGDIIIYQEILYKNKPDFILETGTYRGGSSLFFAHMFDLIGKGHVITVDIHDHNPPKHPRITHLIGRATGEDTLATMREMVGNGTCMVVLDSNHHRSHVKRELVRYHNFVTKGQYMVVEDTCWTEIGRKDGPDEAVRWFMNHNSKFVVDPLENRYVFSLCPGGWLRRR
jgi:cephalosporin hydroxylase